MCVYEKVFYWQRITIANINRPKDYIKIFSNMSTHYKLHAYTYVYATEHTRDGQRVTSMINVEFGSFLRGLPLASNEDFRKWTITPNQVHTKFNSYVIATWMIVEKEKCWYKVG